MIQESYKEALPWAVDQMPCSQYVGKHNKLKLHIGLPKHMIIP